MVSADASLRVTSCQRQAQILILEIFNIFLRLKFSPSLNLNKIEHFSKVSDYEIEEHRFRPLIIRTAIPCFFIFFDSNSIIRFLRATFGSKLRVFQTFSNSVLLHYSVLIRWTLAQWLFHRRDWEQEFRIFFKR